MSGELRRLEFVTTTRDTDHWTADDLAAAEASDADGPHDWAFDQLTEEMRRAGQAFIDRHPDLFATDLFATDLS